jgi:hypothetical protein
LPTNEPLINVLFRINHPPFMLRYLGMSGGCTLVAHPEASKEKHSEL